MHGMGGDYCEHRAVCCISLCGRLVQFMQMLPAVSDDCE